jgi:hypothetical protein
MHRAHKTQDLLNYFDEKDVRVREIPYTLDAQLLNAAAIQLEDVELRLKREIDARVLATTPVHLDNRGVYRAVRLDNELPLAEDQTALSSVRGHRPGDPAETWVPLTPFDDRLPMPTGYVLDETRERVALSDPVVFDVTGSGDAQVQVWDVKTVGPCALEIPNRLTFYVDGVGTIPLFLSVLIEGETYPVPVWMRDRHTTNETLVRLREGCFITTKTWSAVSRMVVRGLPAGVRLRCWKMPFTLPAVPDAARPCFQTAFRGVPFDRYWMLSSDENLLKEMFLLDNFSGLEVATTYALPGVLSAVAVEPQTWGLLVGGGTQLFYVDRREPLPDRLDVTGLTLEPLYGLDCQYNFTRPGAVRYLYIRPVPYGRASRMRLWRYLVEEPAATDGTPGALHVLLPDGSFTEYSGGAGWQRGTPVAVNLPLAKFGTYVITMECLDEQSQVSHDSFPYLNLALTGSSFDLADLVPEIKGIAFDNRENLWVWTGDFAVPLRPRYDNYVLDAGARMLYVTGVFDQISYA